MVVEEVVAMTVQQQRSVVTEEPTQTSGAQRASTTMSSDTTVRPSGAETGRRVAVLVFGLIQIVIALRFILLLLDARTGNALVAGILNVSQWFVGPFEGILHTNAIQAGGSVLDVTAILAFVGWTILELIVLWALGIFRREPS